MLRNYLTIAIRNLIKRKLFSAINVLGLAIFIASLGAFGLTALAVVRRTKEIGIRKVLGASTANISLLLSKAFTKRVMLAILIAWPAAYYALH